jgi:hypothetical protein
LANLGNIIERDTRYLKWTSPKEFRPKTAPTRTPLESVIGDFISPLARCQAGLLSTTGPNRLSSATFAELDEPIQELAQDVDYGVSDGRLDEMIRNLIVAYKKAASQTIKETYIDNILAFGGNETLNLSRLPEVAAKIAAERAQSQQLWLELRPNVYLDEKCKDLRHIMCISGEVHERVNYDVQVEFLISQTPKTSR